MSVPTTEHPSALRMREVADAVGRGDVAAALEHFPEDVVWYAPAAEAADRAYRGRDGLAAFFERIQERAGGTLELEVEEVLGSAQHVVVFLCVRAERGDDRLDVLVAHFARVGPGGFTTNWFLPSDAAAWNTFFG
jgi:ketosteroid isomerase-like protein